MKKRMLAIGAALVIGVLCVPVRTVPPLIRLHVLAESDSEADQATKLEVRDAVLAASQEILGDCDDFSLAYATLDEHLDEIEAAARSSVGMENIRAGIVREIYPDRNYGAFTLPQGEYVSLKVEIGEAQGKNWWCVVYPSLCMPGNAQAEQIPGLMEPRPLRSIVWEWAAQRWQDLLTKMEGTHHV